MSAISNIGGGTAERPAELGPEIPILASLWNEFSTGRARIGKVYSTSVEHHLEWTRVIPGCPTPPRELQFLVRILLGEQQKVVAANAGYSKSTVAMAASKCLQNVGFAGGASATPAVLVMMLHAHCGASFPEARTCRLKLGAPYNVVSVARPDARLSGALSPAEHQVIRLLLDGTSHAEIAASRAISLSTVANQVARAYAKLGVSGRLALLSYLLSDRLPHVARVETASLGSRSSARRASSSSHAVGP